MYMPAYSEFPLRSQLLHTTNKKLRHNFFLERNAFSWQLNPTLSGQIWRLQNFFKWMENMYEFVESASHRVRNGCQKVSTAEKSSAAVFANVVIIFLVGFNF